VIGQTLSHYEITAKLGEGGMGEVYRASDTKLGRDVAIKVLPEAFTQDPERLARFDREARVLAALDHSNIAVIYGLEEAEGRKLLVMQLAEGETLAARIGRGPIPVDEAIPIALQIAEALESAHEKGIIHRDLKPANVKVTPDGQVKLLDFGLAKALETEPDSESKQLLAQSPTLTAQMTGAGVLLGTAAYMAPEQARGKPVDTRADVWAFGVLLYEMLTGRHPFQDEDVSLTLAAVMTSEPDLAQLPREIPPSLGAFLGRCLEKDPKERVQAMGDMRLALEGVFEAGVGKGTSPDVPWYRAALPWLIAVSAAIVAIAVVVSERWVRIDEKTAPRPQRRFTIESAEGTTLVQGLGPAIAISPDGETVVYAAESEAGRRLYRRSLTDFDATPIRGTEGALMPFFSPDGEWVAFGNDTLTEIKRVPLSGGDAFTVCGQCSAGHWGDDGSIVFETLTSVSRIPEIGGEPEVLVEPMPELGIVEVGRPSLLPGGTAVLFDINPFGCGGVGVVSLESQKLLVITDNGTDPFYSPTGHVLFARERTLFAVPFDLGRFEPTGRERPVLSGLRVENGGTAQVELSRNGVLVYTGPGDEIGTQLVWVDRSSGQIQRVLEEGRFFRAPRVAPDGRRIAVQINAGGSCDLWIREGGTLRPLTDTGQASNPIWTPDSRSLTFSSRAQGSFAIQSIPSDGAGEARTLLLSDIPIVPEAWSSDSTQLIFREISSTPDLFVTDVREPGSKRAYVVSDYSEHSAALSPSGEWVGYVSDQTGSEEVYVRPFPGPGGERRVSRGGGEAPSWGRDDSDLVFRSSDEDSVFSASLRLDLSEVVVEKRALFGARSYWNPPGRASYDVHPDGQRLLMLNQRDPNATRSKLRVVENWFSELRTLVGAE
jgi:serine/threonine-protein kinase